jgi:hypothetical protein
LTGKPSRAVPPALPGRLWKNSGRIRDNFFATDYRDDFARVFLGRSGAEEYLSRPLANLQRIVKNPD